MLTLADIEQVRMRLTIQHPWWSALALRLNPIILDDNQHESIHTAATDGRCIYIRSAWWETLTTTQQVGVMIHESLHCGLLHHLRRGNRDIKKWNIATDHAINLILIDADVDIPENHYADPSYAGMSAEEIYNLLPRNPAGGSSCGEVLDGTDENGSQASEWSRSIAAAMHDAKRGGKLSANAQQEMGEALRPRIPWRELLWQYLSRVAGGEDYTWARPNRRLLAITDQYLPSLYAQACSPMCICIDTSGSMSADEISTAVAECRAVLASIRPVTTIIYYADSDICCRIELAPDDDYKPTKYPGGGGTDFQPALIAAQMDDPCAIIYFSDLEGVYPDYYNGPELIWITPSTNTINPPIGHMIRLGDDL